MTDSLISRFYKLSIDERLELLRERGIIDDRILQQLMSDRGFLSPLIADRMVENVIGVFGLPFAVAPNFLVNDKEHVVPMVIEEPSVVAAVSSAARLIRRSGGFAVTCTDPVLIGQIHLCDVAGADEAMARLASAREKIIASANALQPRLVGRGGGAVGLELRKLVLGGGREAIVLHLLVDTRDAMGANTVNTMCERIAGLVEEIGGGSAKLKILSNLADRSLITARATISLDGLGSAGAALRDGIVMANDLANADPYRAATHNKGIMNGMDAVAIATGNDWRALEAGAHAFAVRDGSYRALTVWEATGNGDLRGELRLPVRMGTVGASLRSNPAAVAGLSIAGVESSQELGGLMAAVGLAQNFAALRALAGDGIQKGHMRLHARGVALAAGAPRQHVDDVVKAMIESGEINERKAMEVLQSMPLRADLESRVLRGSGTSSGKVILLGEHAVVYGQPALALPINNAIDVSVFEGVAGTQLNIPAWNYEQTLPRGDALPEGAMALLQFVIRELGVEAGGLLIEVDARIPAAVGLGSSAALAVALIRGISSAFDLRLEDTRINELAFECEKLAHGTPSGIDNTLSVFGHPIVYGEDGHGSFRKLDLRDGLPLVIASSGARGSTRLQIERVRRGCEKNAMLYDRIFTEIGRISLDGADALLRRDFAALGSLMNVCQGLLNALQVSTPRIEQMLEIARSSGAVGAKLTGAGGGGCIIALCPGKESEVSRALANAGFDIIGDVLPRGFAAGTEDDQR